MQKTTTPIQSKHQIDTNKIAKEMKNTIRDGGLTLFTMLALHMHTMLTMLPAFTVNTASTAYFA